MGGHPLARPVLTLRVPISQVGTQAHSSRWAVWRLDIRAQEVVPVAAARSQAGPAGAWGQGYPEEASGPRVRLREPSCTPRPLLRPEAGSSGGAGTSPLQQGGVFPGAGAIFHFKQILTFSFFARKDFLTIQTQCHNRKD